MFKIGQTVKRKEENKIGIIVRIEENYVFLNIKDRPVTAYKISSIEPYKDKTEKKKRRRRNKNKNRTVNLQNNK